MSKQNISDFKEVEERIKAFWDSEEIFKFNPGKGKVYSIDTPPPTVSGAMHIGHSFSYSQQDFIARYKRMNGSVFYPFGTDDNGLPTERLVEKLKNVKSKEMSRSDFIKLCLETLKEITPNFIQDWKDLGISADYKNRYSTIDDNSRKISQKSFIDLFKKGEIYKQGFPTIWCPECQTAIAQAELEDKELPSFFSKIKFKLKDSSEEVLIATTRPELIGACVAVFINPKDPRAKKLVGKKLVAPIFEREVEIFSDESADLEKGTGILMVCSYGDKFDVQAIEKLKLKPRVIINNNGTINLEPYSGLKVRAARKKVLEDLKNKGLIESQIDIKHVVNVHDKCGTEIEFLPVEQWFIRIMDKKDKLLKQGEKISWYPEHMKKRYENWINGLEWDWNISRNRHFGIPIPVWECKSCNEKILPEESELPIDPMQTKKNCPRCKKEAAPETMVLDTWATSSITPKLSSKDFNLKIPFSLRPQGHDIIRTWAFYTITRALLEDKEIPWENIMISGNVSLGGEKMSKSKGNVIDPKKVLSEYGADALRFWAAGSKLGGDLDYQEKDLVTGKKIINKLTNATKFVFMNLEGYDGFSKPNKLELIDQEFLAKLDALVLVCTKAFEEYEYSQAKIELEKFFWTALCDNYLEIVKKRVYQRSGDEKLSAQYVLHETLFRILQLFAPFMPFITENLYLEYFKKSKEQKSIHLTTWPKVLKIKGGVEFDKFVELLSKVRQEKTNAKKAMNSEIIVYLEKDSLKKELLEDFKNVMNIREIKQGSFKVEFL